MLWLLELACLLYDVAPSFCEPCGQAWLCNVPVVYGHTLEHSVDSGFPRTDGDLRTSADKCQGVSDTLQWPRHQQASCLSRVTVFVQQDSCRCFPVTHCILPFLWNVSENRNLWCWHWSTGFINLSSFCRGWQLSVSQTRFIISPSCGLISLTWWLTCEGKEPVEEQWNTWLNTVSESQSVV